MDGRRGMKLCWQALIFQYLYTFKPGGESAFGSSPPDSHTLQRDVCIQNRAKAVGLGQAITCLPRPRGPAFSVTCTVYHQFSHDRSQSTTESSPRQPTERQYSPTDYNTPQVISLALLPSAQWPNVLHSANANHTIPPRTDGVS